MTGAPGFCAFRINCKSGRNQIQFLFNESQFNNISVSRPYSLLKFSPEAFAYYKDNLTETSPYRVINRIIHNCLSAWAHSVQLFQSSVPAPHTCGQYQ